MAGDHSGTGLCMYASAGGEAASAAKEQGKLAQPEVKWELKNVHDKKGIVSLVGSPATFGSGNGGVLLASSSEGVVSHDQLVFLSFDFGGSDLIIDIIPGQYALL